MGGHPSVRWHGSGCPAHPLAATEPPRRSPRVRSSGYAAARCRSRGLPRNNRGAPAKEETARLLRHLESLTWSFTAGTEPVYPIYVYCEPRETARGVVYAPRVAAESGMEGVACLDDVARAATLGALTFARTGDVRAATLARRWVRFVYYMQREDGRFTNFILDRTGRRNNHGTTSFPGGAWWTVRALLALATSYRVFDDTHALAALDRCPIPSPETPGELKTRAVLVLAGLEIIRSRAPSATRALWRRRVRRWCDAMVRAAEGRPYVPDYLPNQAPAAPDQEGASLWGYHQLHALAGAATILRDPVYLEVAERTVWGLVRPVLAGNFYYRYPSDRANQCAYCVAPLVQGLAELYRVTGASRYRTLALRAAEWFAGANDAGASMYDAGTGRCFDGLTGTLVSRNCGAESAIEAGFAELERRALATPREQPRRAELIR